MIASLGTSTTFCAGASGARSCDDLHLRGRCTHREPMHPAQAFEQVITGFTQTRNAQQAGVRFGGVMQRKPALRTHALRYLAERDRARV